MNNTKDTFRINWFIGTLTLLATGVLVGCEYCGPLLLAVVTGAIVYRFTELVHGAMKTQSKTKSIAH